MDCMQMAAAAAPEVQCAITALDASQHGVLCGCPAAGQVQRPVDGNICHLVHSWVQHDLVPGPANEQRSVPTLTTPRAHATGGILKKDAGLPCHASWKHSAEHSMRILS